MSTGIPLTYLVVPKMEYVVLRVQGHHPNRKKLIDAVRSGDVLSSRLRNESRMLWSKTRVREEILK